MTGFNFNWTNDLVGLDTPQEYLHQIREKLINAVDNFGDRLTDYPIIKTMARITLIAFFVFRLLRKN